MEILRHGHPAVIFQGLGTGWFGIIADKRNVTDLQPLGSGEKGHIGRIMIEGIDQTAFFQYTIVQTGFPGFQGTGQSYWSGTHDKYRNMKRFCSHEVKISRLKIAQTTFAILR